MKQKNIVCQIQICACIVIHEDNIFDKSYSVEDFPSTTFADDIVINPNYSQMHKFDLK